jgi:hypothetical protein
VRLRRAGAVFVASFAAREYGIDTYGYDEAYLLAVEARQELLALAEGFVGVAPIPKRFRPSG